MSHASPLNARAKSTTLGVFLEAEIGGRRSRRNNTETFVKKKIRAIQYGVGPIGASIAKLMREKQAIDIIGAIDMDPAKAGRDLGEVVGAGDAPWESRFSPMRRKRSTRTPTWSFTPLLPRSRK